MNLVTYVRWLKEIFGWDYPPVRMSSYDMQNIVRDHERMNRHVWVADSECGPAMTMFMLRSYSGRRECFSVDTATKTLIPLVFFVRYRGQHELFPDLNIRPLR